MFDGGNISGFFAQTGRNDGTGDYNNSSNGNYKQRLKNRENHYYQSQGIDTETGEVLDFKPNTRLKNPYRMKANFKKLSSGLPLPAPGKLIDIAVLGAIGLGGFILYQKVFKPFLSKDPVDKANDDAEKAAAAAYVSTSKSELDRSKATATSLAGKGIVMSDLHKGNADYLHGLLDSNWVDHDQIVKTIMGMSKQTFQLVAVAYGRRSLPNYVKGYAHIANVSLWTTISSIWTDDVWTDTLKNQLKAILTSSELAKLSSWLDAIK